MTFPSRNLISLDQLQAGFASVAFGPEYEMAPVVPWALAAVAASEPSMQQQMAPALLRRVRRIINYPTTDRIRNVVTELAYRPLVRERHLGSCYWSLGQAALGIPGEIGQRATRLADRFIGFQPHDGVTIAMMACGADALLKEDPSSLEAKTVLDRSAPRLLGPRQVAEWIWPLEALDPRDAVLAHAFIAAGECLDHCSMVRAGLQLLDWRLHRNGISGDRTAELATSVAACTRAQTVTGVTEWTHRAQELVESTTVPSTMSPGELCNWFLALRHIAEFNAVVA